METSQVGWRLLWAAPNHQRAEERPAKLLGSHLTVHFLTRRRLECLLSLAPGSRMEDYLSVQNKRMGELSISINIRIRLLNVRFELSTFFVSNTNIIRNKFALL